MFSKTNGFYFCLEIARKIPKNIRGIWNYFGKNLSDFFWSSCLLYKINLISQTKEQKQRTAFTLYFEIEQEIKTNIKVVQQQLE